MNSMENIRGGHTYKVSYEKDKIGMNTRIKIRARDFVIVNMWPTKLEYD
jgi:hypothetical protein